MVKPCLGVAGTICIGIRRLPGGTGARVTPRVWRRAWLKYGFVVTFGDRETGQARRGGGHVSSI